jgi:hypothetical protein
VKLFTAPPRPSDDDALTAAGAAAGGQVIMEKIEAVLVSVFSCGAVACVTAVIYGIF